ncbi:MAG: right-handed parallel beta-helix repeat-containing protein, partial [Oscillospiraceae bacterium]|nr:right-handed parallel beta-helix repeat-containing protein [Candidatus Equicaccousia limihippi]
DISKLKTVPQNSEIVFENDLFITKPLCFSGLCKVRFRAMQNVGIYGGIKLGTPSPDRYCGDDCVSYELPQDLCEINPRDFFVCGERAQAVRFPKEGIFYAKGTEFPDTTKMDNHSSYFIAYKEDLGEINPCGATVNFFHYWIDEHITVGGYEPQSGKITLNSLTTMTVGTARKPENCATLKYYFTGISGVPLNEGEWAYDKSAGKIYYKPKSGQDLLKGAFLPIADRIFDFKNCKNVTLSGLKLAYTDSRYQNRKEWVAGDEQYDLKDRSYGGDPQSCCFMHGAINFNGCAECRVLGCEIYSVGTHGISVETACNNITVQNCRIYDTGGGAVRIYGGTLKQDKSLITQNITVKNNDFSLGGRIYGAAVGILCSHASYVNIIGNRIHGYYYSGISCGWVWGYFASATHHCKISRNEIFDIGGGMLSDMGGINTLGPQEGTIISHNRIHNIKASFYGDWGIYLDEGSSGIKVFKNTVSDTGTESFMLHYGKNNRVFNNRFYGENGMLTIENKEEHVGVIIYNNLFYTDGNAVWGKNSQFASAVSYRNKIYSNENSAVYIDPEGKEYSLAEFTEKTGLEKDSRFCRGK